MRSLFRLAIAGLFLACDVSASNEETTIEASSVDAPSHELHYVDRDIQSRRKEWDMFSFMMMALQGGCGDVMLHDCNKKKNCLASGNSNDEDCVDLCKRKNNALEKHHNYGRFCDLSLNYSSDGSSANANAANAANNADEYNGNSTPEGVVGSGNYAMEFQFWMVAVAVSVGMALVAVHMGQRREDFDENEDKSLLGANVRGSVGRRVGVVSGLMDGVLGGETKGPKQVELAEFELEPSNSYESAMV